MSDFANQHQFMRRVAAIKTAPRLPATLTTSVARSGTASDEVLRSSALEPPGPLRAPLLAGRVQRSSSVSSPPTTQLSEGAPVDRIQRAPFLGPLVARTPAIARIQRSPLPGSITGPAQTIAHNQPMPGGITVQRDFSEAMKSAGRGIASAAKATGKFVESSATAVKNAAVGVAHAIHRSDFNDLNATQYLVSAGGKIEAINRRVDDDGTVVYYRTGSVTVGNGDRPTIDDYDQPIAMPDGWLPTVTHINGMMVKPNGGLGSAIKLQQELEKAGGEALLTTDVPSVLYTYSAHRGFVTDLAECVSGKLYLDDDATDRQTQIMLDAVKNQHRTTVSAHSRGTIKTDNAVRNAHAQISAEHLPAALADPDVLKVAKEAARVAAQMNSGMGLTADMLEPVYQRLFAREHSDKLATVELDKFVQLIYAGNAVQFPSASMNLNLVVAGSDPVTIGVGKYFGFAKGSKTKMTDVAGGHGFNASYASTVAQLIIADLQAHQK